MYSITTPNGSCQHPQRQAIPLLCLGHDLTAEYGLGSHLRSLGQALAKLGWQIDLIGQYPGPRLQVDGLVPHCRVIRLAISPDQASSVPDLYEALRTFEKRQGHAYPLLHSLDSLSAQVGAAWKQQSLVPKGRSKRAEGRKGMSCHIRVSALANR